MFTIDELKYLKNMLNYEFCNVEQKNNEHGATILNKIDKILEQVEGERLVLWRFYWDCGRQGEVEGLFKATKEEVENVIGKDVDFGEILGKHSEVYGTIEDGDIELVSDNPIEVMSAKEFGYNPLNYISYTCSKCGCTYSKDDFNVEKDICNYCNEEED